VPRRAKIAIVFAGLWVASPIDLILAAWPGEPRLLERLLGPTKPTNAVEQ